MNKETMYKLASRIMKAPNRATVMGIIKDLPAEDIIILREKYGVKISAEENDQALLKQLQITRKKIQENARRKKKSSDSN
jgi:hypothetical protein